MSPLFFLVLFPPMVITTSPPQHVVEILSGGLSAADCHTRWVERGGKMYQALGYATGKLECLTYQDITAARDSPVFVQVPEAGLLMQ